MKYYCCVARYVLGTVHCPVTTRRLGGASDLPGLTDGRKLQWNIGVAVEVNTICRKVFQIVYTQREELHRAEPSTARYTALPGTYIVVFFVTYELWAIRLYSFLVSEP